MGSEGAAGVQGPCAGQAFLHWGKKQAGGLPSNTLRTSGNHQLSPASSVTLSKSFLGHRVQFLVFNHLKPTLLCIALISPHNNPGSSYFKHHVTYRETEATLVSGPRHSVSPWQSWD